MLLLSDLIFLHATYNVCTELNCVSAQDGATLRERSLECKEKLMLFNIL